MLGRSSGLVKHADIYCFDSRNNREAEVQASPRIPRPLGFISDGKKLDKRSLTRLLVGAIPIVIRALCTTDSELELVLLLQDLVPQCDKFHQRLRALKRHL